MTDWTKSLASLTMATAVAPGAALGDAQVTKLRWQGNPGSKLELVGADFGGGPTVRLFDTFTDEGNADRPTAVDSPSWFKRDVVRIDNKHALLGGGSSVVADTATDFRNVMVFQPEGNDTPHGTEAFQEIYFGYAVKDVGNFPGTGGTETTFADRSSAKDAWLMLGRKGSGGYQIDDPWVGNDTVIPTHVSGTFKIDGNSGGPGLWRGDIAANWAFQDWNQFFFHGVIDAANSEAGLSGMFGYVNENASRFDEIEGPLVSGYTKDQDLKPKKRYWDRLKFGSWYHLGNGDVHRLHDAIYIATGSNANARVMLGNSRYLKQVTRLHHAYPSEWSEGKIVADVSHIDTSTTQDWFVFVTNGDGQLPLEGTPLREAETDTEDQSSGATSGSAPDDATATPDKADSSAAESEGKTTSSTNEIESGDTSSGGGSFNTSLDEDLGDGGDGTTNKGQPNNSVTGDPSQDGRKGSTSGAKSNQGSSSNGSATSKSTNKPPANPSAASRSVGSGPSGSSSTGKSSGGGGSRGVGEIANESETAAFAGEQPEAASPDTTASTSEAASNADANTVPANTSSQASADDNSNLTVRSAGAAGLSNSTSSDTEQSEPVMKPVRTSNIGSFVGNAAQLEMDDGRIFAGRIQSVDGQNVRVRIDLEGGYVGYSIQKSQIKDATISR